MRGFREGSGGGWAGVAATGWGCGGGGGGGALLLPAASVLALLLLLQAAVPAVAVAAAIVSVCGVSFAMPWEASGGRRGLSGGREPRRPGLGRARGAGGVRGGPAPPRAGHARPSVLGLGALPGPTRVPP
jgi:hypothetical protein